MKISMSNKGTAIIITPFVWCTTIFLFIFFLVLSIRLLEPFLIYQKISETSLKYIFIIEEYGYLAEENKKNMEKDLYLKGLDPERIKVTAPVQPVEYGKVVELDIEYIHKLKLPSFNKNKLMPNFVTEDMKIRISKKGVSKC